MIELKDFTKNYGDFTALDKVNCTFTKDCITGILGPNGAGKTTILKAICARHFATEGKLFIDSARYGRIEASENPAETRNITGFVEESPDFPGEYTVREFLKATAELHGASLKNLEETVKLFSLEDVFHKKIKTLSKGYRERVNFAQAFVYRPEILVLDEPASGLDPEQIVKMRESVKKLAENHTVILSTHLMQEAESLCDRIIVLNHGKILADGTIPEVIEKAKAQTLEQAFFTLVHSADINGKNEQISL